MTYTATQLITEAYYTSGILARDAETISGDQLSDGLSLLNDLIAVKTANLRLIPYYQQFNLNTVVGQEEYFIPNLVSVESVTFNIGPLRYSMIHASRTEYFASGRVDNIESLPGYWHTERADGGSNLFIYFLPADIYQLRIWGKFSLASVALNEDLSAIYERYFIVYLRYALADYVAEFNNIQLPPGAAQKLRELETTIVDISPIDLTMQKMSTLQDQTTLNYADINIGRGWRPG